MKPALTITAAAFFFFCCNNSKEKNAPGNNEVKDSVNANKIIPSTTGQHITELPDTTPVPAHRLIIPGKSIGLTYLDQKQDDVMKQLGSPASGDASMGGHSEAIWYSKPVIHGTDTVINETDVFFYTNNFGEPNQVVLVDHIKITSGYFLTAQHVGTGSSLDTIQKYFPGIKKTGTDTLPKTKKQVVTYDDEHAGIGFDVEDGKCVAISVYKPGE
jgi:hypothetical protein